MILNSSWILWSSLCFLIREWGLENLGYRVVESCELACVKALCLFLGIIKRVRFVIQGSLSDFIFGKWWQLHVISAKVEELRWGCEVVAVSPLGQCVLKKYQKTDFTVKMDFYERAILKQIPSYCGHSFSHHCSYWVGRIPWRREWLPTPVFWPGEFHGLYSPWVRKESDKTEHLSVSLWFLLIPSQLIQDRTELEFGFICNTVEYGF